MIGDTRFIGYCAVFKVREEAARPSPARELATSRPADAGLSKLNSMWATPLEHEARACRLPGSVDIPRPDRQAAGTASSRMLPRKEVIQPQLPLRLPCYDFTPVTSPTFDGSLPCGLGHRLRVLLTPVV
jgi:hypothetical protein